MLGADRTPQVVILGGGVAGLEALMALRDLAGDRVEIALIAPQSDFTYRPLAVEEPFSPAPERRALEPAQLLVCVGGRQGGIATQQADAAVSVVFSRRSRGPGARLGAGRAVVRSFPHSGSVQPSDDGWPSPSYLGFRVDAAKERDPRRRHRASIPETRPVKLHPRVRRERRMAVIAGGGVAALEAMLALRHLSGDLLDVELVSPTSDFHYRPLQTSEPFEDGFAPRYSLFELCAPRGVRHRLGAVAAVDSAGREVWLKSGEPLDYDFLLLAIGAQPRAAIPNALTFWSGGTPSDVRRLLEDLEAGQTRRVVFAVPPGVTWALPLYELALQAAARLEQQGIDGRSLTLVTPERAPLAIFGRKASAEVEALLLSRGIALVTEARPQSLVQGELTLEGGDSVPADRVVALPRLLGPELEGVPRDKDGFIPTDEHARVCGLEAVYAAGDATNSPVKQGGVAAQQADAAAEMIAREAGASVVPKPFRPVMRGVLHTGDLPRYMRTELGEGNDERSAVATHAFWWPPGKIAGRYLAPYLSGVRPINTPEARKDLQA